MLVDSHCHLDKLDLSSYNGDLDAAVQAAFDRGVSHIVCIGIDLEKMDAVIDLAERYERVFATAGVHPLYQTSQQPDLNRLIELAGHPKVIGIGETGLDYFYAEGDTQCQRDSFRMHIGAARETKLPLVIHTRGAKQDTLSDLKTLGKGDVSGVLHCFTEDLDMAKQAIDMGFYISISGIVTFNNASELRDVVKALPLDRLLVETDAPWLAPKPYRGKKNEPQYVVEVAHAVAEQKNIEFEQVAQVTSDNFFRLFNKAQKVL